MAFDFVSYIESTFTAATVLPEQTGEQKQQYMLHIIAIVIHVYHQEFQQDAATSYQLLKQKSPEIVQRITQRSLEIMLQQESATQFFTPIQSSLSDVTHRITQHIADELLALDDMSHLGIEGIQELLVQQYEAIQPLVQPWFWSAIDHTPLAAVVEAPVDAQAVMHEFNQMMQNGLREHEHPTDPINVSSEMTTNHQVAPSIPSQHAATPMQPPKLNPKPNHKKEIFLFVTVILLLLSLFLIYQSMR